MVRRGIVRISVLNAMVSGDLFPAAGPDSPRLNIYVKYFGARTAGGRPRGGVHGNFDVVKMMHINVLEGR